MKKIIISIILLSNIAVFYSQDDMAKYDSLINKAYQSYKTKDFISSANYYSEAFKSISWKAYPNDRYNAACSWALANVADSSFKHLENLAKKQNYSNYGHITTDSDLNSIHEDKRWEVLIKKVLENKQFEEKDFNHELVSELDKIHEEDQGGRQKLDEIEQKFGRESKQMDSLWADINLKDSINLEKIIKILDKNGWVGPEVIGQRGVQTVFLVIQHSPLPTQEKYLPIMREACKNGKMAPSSLALLEDRVANRNGKLQIYGSQISFDKNKQIYYLLPVEDPDNIDKRRSEMNLGPISDYVSNWQIVWDVEEYKKNLPYYLELQKGDK